MTWYFRSVQYKARKAQLKEDLERQHADEGSNHESDALESNAKD